MRRISTMAWLSFQRFTRHDAWAIASHIALSLLMALFPFLIVLTALASLIGQTVLAGEAVDIVLDGWPKEVAQPIAREIHAILTGGHSGVITFGVVFALYFSSGGVESLRVGLNRAYDVREKRPWWLTRLESIGYVVGGAVLMLAIAFLVVLGPTVWEFIMVNLTRYFPSLAELPQWDAGPRLAAATVIVVLALFFIHMLVPAERRGIWDVLPGIVVTLALWLCAGLAFGWYLELFPGAYSSTYGGLATAMMVLVFLYTLAAIFLFGGEINGLLKAIRSSRNAAIIEGERIRARGDAVTSEGG